MRKKYSETGLRRLFLSVLVGAMTMFSLQAVAAPEQITGRVVDVNGEPLIGANVTEQGTTNGTITDFEGMFVLSVEKNTTLVVSYVGYKDQEVRAQKDMVVMLKENTQMLDEVVAVGYGTQKKANLTGAVTTVDVSKALESKTETDVAKALQGAVPGLTITNQNGDISADPTIVIRGVGSLSNSAASKPLYIVDGVPMDNLGYLNPNDIESISVLKDAASTSIYGTRAAFGVVLVTTKTAKTAEKVSVTYNNNFAWSRASALPNYPTVKEQITAMTDANNRVGDASELFGMYFNTEDFINKVDAWQAKHGGKAGYRAMVYGDDYDENGYYADWDVAGILFNNAAPSQSHNLSVQGNSGKTNYYMSLGYNHQQGIMNFNPDKMDKFNATVNLSTKVTKWLEVGARFNMQHRTYTYPYVRGQGSYQYAWRWGSFFGPWGYFEDADGNQYDARNMIGFRKQGGDAYRKRMNLRAGGFIKLNLAKGLTFNGDYTYTYRTNRYKGVGTKEDLVNTWSLQGKDFAHGSISSNDFIETSNDLYTNHVANMYFNYNATWAKAHNFNVMIGANIDKDDYEYLYYERHDMQDENKPELALTASDYSYSHSRSHNGSAGVFGRINYDYKGIYLFEFNARGDASSKFPAGHQWAFFPSGSVGYRISEEPYFEPAKAVMSNLKIRASYGTIGNQEIGDLMFIETMTKNRDPYETSDTKAYWLGDGSVRMDYFGQPKMVSPALTWETIATANVGIDLGFFDNDLNIGFDWYQRDTKDMLAPGKALPQVIGATAAYENAGSLRTRGWELSIDYRHIFTDIDNFELYANFNLSDYKATITEWESNNLINTNYTGKEYGEIWGFQTDRYFTADDFNGKDAAGHPIYAAGVADQSKLEKGKFVYGPGDIKFVDQNGDGVIDWGDGTPDNHGDLVKIGNTTPRYQYSFRLGAAWKGIDIDLFFQGVGKRDMWTQSAFVMPMMRGVDAVYANQTSYVTEEMVANGNIDQSVTYPRMFGGNAGAGAAGSSIMDNGCNNFYPQDKYLVNMAYLRLKNLTVGYTLPQKWTRKATIEKFRIYASFNNLADLINHTKQYGLDPEITTGTGALSNGVFGRTEPIYRSYSFGFQITL